MSLPSRLVLVLGLAAFAAACAPKPEPVYTPVEPVSVEPDYTGKYK
jgi:hypothetical protein